MHELYEVYKKIEDTKNIKFLIERQIDPTELINLSLKITSLNEGLFGAIGGALKGLYHGWRSGYGTSDQRKAIDILKDQMGFAYRTFMRNMTKATGSEKVARDAFKQIISQEADSETTNIPAISSDKEDEDEETFGNAGQQTIPDTSTSDVSEMPKEEKLKPRIKKRKKKINATVKEPAEETIEEPTGEMKKAESYYRKMDYSDIRNNSPEPTENQKKYALELARQNPAEVEKIVNELWNEAHKLLEKLRESNEFLATLPKDAVEPFKQGASGVLESKAWAYWDIGKQLYLMQHPNESNDKYKLGNPLTDIEVQKDIIYRMIGYIFSREKLSSHQYTKNGREIIEKYIEGKESTKTLPEAIPSKETTVEDKILLKKLQDFTNEISDKIPKNLQNKMPFSVMSMLKKLYKFDYGFGSRELQTFHKEPNVELLGKQEHEILLKDLADIFKNKDCNFADDVFTDKLRKSLDNFIRKFGATPNLVKELIKNDKNWQKLADCLLDINSYVTNFCRNHPNQCGGGSKVGFSGVQALLKNLKEEKTTLNFRNWLLSSKYSEIYSVKL